jgi:hypothetical protein
LQRVCSLLIGSMFNNLTRLVFQARSGALTRRLAKAASSKWCSMQSCLWMVFTWRLCWRLIPTSLLVSPGAAGESKEASSSGSSSAGGAGAAATAAADEDADDGKDEAEEAGAAGASGALSAFFQEADRGSNRSLCLLVQALAGGKARAKRCVASERCSGPRSCCCCCYSITVRSRAESSCGSRSI